MTTTPEARPPLERAIDDYLDDYEQPLQVRWVCPQCHADIHRLEK